jgi:hypothetical protein
VRIHAAATAYKIPIQWMRDSPTLNCCKRWAEAKSITGTPVKKAGRKAKRKMSAAGREWIAEATRKRWATYRAQKAALASLSIGDFCE